VGFNAAAAYVLGADLTAGRGVTQTFSQVGSIEGVTFRFITNSLSSFPTTNLTTYFSSWSGTDAVASIAVGSIAVATDSAWTNIGGGFYTYDATIDLTAVASSLTPASTYGLTLVGDVVSNLNYRLAAGTLAYPDGNGFTNGGPINIFSDLAAGGAAYGLDFAFASVAMTPVPEASTVTVGFAGVFVAGLAALRMRQRRLQAAGPAVAA
jgi:hypothetical protein